MLYLILGTFLTPSEIILVTVPVLLPVAQAAGVHPIHFGIVCVIASAVGHITPPVGLCLFVGMAISGLPMDKLVKPLLPFLAAIVATLLLVAFIPEVALACRACWALRGRSGCRETNNTHAGRLVGTARVAPIADGIIALQGTGDQCHEPTCFFTFTPERKQT